MAERKVI